MSEPGMYKGKPISTLVDQVKELLRDASRLDEAEDLLWNLIRSTEAESAATGHGVVPWYYDRLARVYNKKGDYEAELQILDRLFSKYRRGPGVLSRQLLAQLEKARQRVGRGTPLQGSREEAEVEMANLFTEWSQQQENSG